MFCDKPEEMRIFDAICEKKPYLNEFEKHYLNLAVWCYVNQPDKFREIVEAHDRQPDDFDNYKILIENEANEIKNDRCLEEIKDVD